MSHSIISRLRLCKEMSNMELSCPRPLRPTVKMGPADIQLCRPSRKLTSCTSLPAEGDPGREILEILLDKACSVESSNGFTPLAFGSPPSRASNPLIHDVQFTQKKAVPSSLFLTQNNSCKQSGNSTFKKSSSCITYGSTPFVRIEGFASAKPDAHEIPAFA